MEHLEYVTNQVLQCDSLEEMMKVVAENEPIRKYDSPTKFKKKLDAMFKELLEEQNSL